MSPYMDRLRSATVPTRVDGGAQLSLEDLPTARHSDPATSHEAASDATPLSGRHRRIALAALRYAGSYGMTDFELAAATGVQQTSIGVRRKELVRAGFVEATEQRRLSPSGSSAIVWRVKE